MPAAAVEFKYPLGTCLHEGDRDAVFETECEGKPAVVKFIRPESSFESAKLISRYAAAAKLRHPNIVPILDYGEAEVFETAVVFLVTERGHGAALHPKSDIAAGLQFLHANGYAHGAVAASSIVSFGETARLYPATIQLASQGEKDDDIEALNLLYGGSSEPGDAVPIYRKHAKLAIGGVVAAGALCLLLVRNAEHKAPPPPPPVVVHQQQLRPEVVKAEPVRQVAVPKAHHKRTRHKRR